MASIIKRTWTSTSPTGRRLKQVSWGYDLRLANGTRERRVCLEWRTETDALEALNGRLEEIKAGRLDPVTVTLGQLAEEYLRYKGDHGKRSLREDTRILKKRLLPAFGAELPARRLTGEMIAQYEKRRAGEKKSNGEPISAFTVANELTVLRHMLRLGRRWGYLDQAPEIEMPKKPEGRRRYLEEDEIQRLLIACAESKNPYLYAIVTIALNTGMRKQEILGLEWERLDLSRGTITLYKTKSGKPRGIPMLRSVYDVLIAAGLDPERRIGLVFARRDGAAWGQVRTAFTNALTKAKIPDFRFHDLRHTFASHYAMRGGSLKALQEILGHSDYKMTQRYAHLSPAHLRSDMERMEGLTVGHMNGHISGKIQADRLVNPYAPVAQVDRAAVS